MVYLMDNKLFRKNILVIESITDVINTVWILTFTNY